MSDCTGVPNTCPDIDNIIDHMQYAVDQAEYIRLHHLENSEDEAHLIIDYLKTAIRDMEDIRGSNADLREFGVDKNKECERLIDDLDDKNREIDQLEVEVDRLKDEISDLELNP